jgi:hypothetical protein
MSKWFKKPPICEAARVLKDCRATGKKNTYGYNVEIKLLSVLRSLRR